MLNRIIIYNVIYIEYERKGQKNSEKRKNYNDNNYINSLFYFNNCNDNAI